MKVIVTADDYGLTADTCAAILDAHERGVVTATSVLAPIVTDGDLRRARDSGLAVGVHVCVVGEDPPLLSAHEVPTLVDRSGRLARSWRQLVARLVTGRVDPDDLRREIGAQIDRVDQVLHACSASSGRERPAGSAITHLDSHQHVHLWPAVGDVVVGLARQRGIERVRLPRPTRPNRGRGLAVDRLTGPLAERIERAGRCSTDRFLGLDEAGHWDTERLSRAVRHLATEHPQTSSLEINVHPGPALDPERARYDWAYEWGKEHAALVDPGIVELLRTPPFELVDGRA